MAGSQCEAERLQQNEAEVLILLQESGDRTGQGTLWTR